MKTRYVYLIFMLLLVLTGCAKKREAVEGINTLMIDYENAMKEQNYELADSYWCNPEDNSFSYYPQKIEDAEELYMQACEEIYAERFTVEISNIKISESSATADITVSLCNFVSFIEDIPNSYDYEELTQRKYEEIKADFELDLAFYYESEDGKVTFEKVGDSWKIKSMEWQ